MQFNEKQKVIIESLTVPEASAFIKFLETEVIRHMVDIEKAEELIIQVRNMYRLGQSISEKE